MELAGFSDSVDPYHEVRRQAWSIEDASILEYPTLLGGSAYSCPP